MNITAYDLALRFVGTKEVPGLVDNPMVLAMLKLDNSWPEHDEVAWCSAFVNFIAWMLRIPRSKNLRARSWLDVGRPLALGEARPGFDVVILSRGSNIEQGHVGFFAGLEGDKVLLLGGNQSNSVSVAAFPVGRVVGVRRLWT